MNGPSLSPSPLGFVGQDPKRNTGGGRHTEPEPARLELVREQTGGNCSLNTN